MKLRILSMFVVVGALGATTAGVVACNSAQARPVCLVGHGEYGAKYVLKAGQTVTGACATKHGDILGLEKFNPPATPADQTIAIKPYALNLLSGGPEAGHADLAIIAQGKLDPALGGDPDKDNFCTAPSLAPISFDTGTDTIGYTFTTVKFYVTAQIPGTQFTANLAYTEGGCTANYDVTGIFPVVTCDDGDGNPDQTLCAGADPNTGLSANPEFPLVCDADTLICVLDKLPVPQLCPTKTSTGVGGPFTAGVCKPI